MIKCPYCGFTGDLKDFKLLRDSWKFSFYTVRRLECPKCHGIFQYYQGETKSKKNIEFTIKIKPKQK